MLPKNIEMSTTFCPQLIMRFVTVFSMTEEITATI